jgi:RNA polymerase sigma-B factor
MGGSRLRFRCGAQPDPTMDRGIRRATEELSDQLLQGDTGVNVYGLQDPDGETALILRYRQSGKPEDLEAIVNSSKGLVVALARRFRDRGPELDDLIQVAHVGLLLAISRFDPERGVPFVGFATPTILGELRRHFRTVWSVRMPRSLQEASQLLGPATNDLRHELLRSPTISEVAARTGLTKERVLEAMEAGSAFRAKSLDAPVLTEGGDGSPLHASLPSNDAGAAFSAFEAKDIVERLLPLLSPRSRQIVKLRFYEERNQTEIAEIVGVSQMHVSRLLTQALEFFGNILNAEPEA